MCNQPALSSVSEESGNVWTGIILDLVGHVYYLIMSLIIWFRWHMSKGPRSHGLTQAYTLIHIHISLSPQLCCVYSVLTTPVWIYQAERWIELWPDCFSILRHKKSSFQEATEFTNEEIKSTEYKVIIAYGGGIKTYLSAGVRLEDFKWVASWTQLSQTTAGYSLMGARRLKSTKNVTDDDIHYAHNTKKMHL